MKITKWKLQYFLVNSEGRMSCLFCDTAVVMVKKFNEQQHYVLHKENKYVKLEGKSQKTALQKLEGGK